MGARLQDLKSQLNIGSSGVSMVGIWGIGGGGKTTLASSLYIEISGKFDSCCFVGNIKEESSKHGIESLQGKILSTVLKTEVQVWSVDIGKHMIKSRLGRRNVLIILDNVDDHKQLEALAGSCDWFGDGSRIVITTRDEHLLRAHKINKVLSISLLSDEEAIRLFNKHAYNETNFVEDYGMLSLCVVSYAGGLPLALKVLGSFLYDKGKNEWISTLDRLKGNPEMEIVEKLKISYDGLKPLEKELFLDIACLCRGMKKDDAMVMLDACGFHPVIGVKVLIQKALITICSYDYGSGKQDIFDMHDLVQEMGHFIVRGEHPNNPQKHTRLWILKEIKDMCALNEAMENNITEAIICSSCPSGFGKLVSNMKKLRFLTVYNYLNEGDTEGPDFLSNELRYMSWEMYPPSLFPESFQPRKLVVLKLDKSLQKEIWKGYKFLQCLKELQLRSAPNLVRTPDFGELPCLQKLALSDCSNLEEIHPSLGNHSSLVELHLNCVRLPSMPHLPCFIRRLTLCRCGLKDREIPRDIRELSNLQELDLSYNIFSRFSFNLSQLTRLKLLNLRCCMFLVELPKLPTSIAILKADGCSSLEVIGDIHTNCKWLCQVSLRFVGSLIGGDYLLQSMLQGNAIENLCMCLHLRGLEIPNGFIPGLLLKGSRYRLQLPENWYIHFSGFLMCATLKKNSNSSQFISMKHENRSWMNLDSHMDVYWEEGIDDVETWVGYVSFGSLTNTMWWESTSTAIELSFEYESESCSGFGVTLVSKRSQMETTTDSSESSDDYTCNFIIGHDSKSDLKCLFSLI